MKRSKQGETGSPGGTPRLYGRQDACRYRVGEAKGVAEASNYRK